MKLVSVALTALAVATVQAAPSAEAQDYTNPDGVWCTFPGQVCGKAKRSAEPAAEAVAASGWTYTDMNRWCHFPGQVCGKAKRSADEIDVVKRSAEAMAEPFEMNRWCHFPGQVCGKAKRAADAIDNVKRSADAVAEAMAFLRDLTPEEYAKVESYEE